MNGSKFKVGHFTYANSVIKGLELAFKKYQYLLPFGCLLKLITKITVVKNGKLTTIEKNIKT
jgi:hypothetical protein